MTMEHSEGPPESVIRIVLVDDHALVREGIEGVLRKHPDLCVVASVASGAEALAACQSHAVDVVLLDLKMPHMDGVETLARIRKEHPKLPVVMLTSDDRQESIRRAVQVGAAGFLLKSMPSKDLAASIRQVAATGRLPLAPHLSRRLLATTSYVRLTERERDVLQRLASGDANEDVAAALGISANTLKTHTQRILSKLDASTRTEAVLIGIRFGLIDVDGG